VKVRTPALSGRREELGIFGGVSAPGWRAVLSVLVVWGRLAMAQVPEAGPTVQVTNDSIHREIIVELSPLSLPAHASHHSAKQPPPRAVALPLTGWIEGYSAEVVDSAGHPIPREILHHLNLIVPERRELFSTIMQRMGAAGAETPPVAMPAVFGHPVVGYPVHRGDTVLVVAMLHNPTARSYEGARLRVRLPYATERTWPHPVSIFPFYLDVMPPAGGHAYPLPPGHSERSWEGRPAVPGRILAVGGHLHEYGVALRLEDVTAGRVLWQTAPVTNAAGEIVSIPTHSFWWRLGLPIRPDHTYRLTAVYDNPTGKAIPDGAMGALGGVFLPDNVAAWPAVDRTSAEYQRDVQVTYETGMGDMNDMQGMHDMSDMSDMRSMHDMPGPLSPSRTAQTP